MQSEFVKAHLYDDVYKLLLEEGRYEGIDVRDAVVQIQARRAVRDKLPQWYADFRLRFPSVAAAEQCSSAQAAQYKQHLISRAERLCDLTGGLGVDAYYFALKAASVTYIEKNADYCACAEHNFKMLEANNIKTFCADALEALSRIDETDVFYIDPSRRNSDGKRLYALTDCEPDILQLLPLLRKRLIAKLSPMADVCALIRLLPRMSAMHVVAVRNECKEILAVIESEEQPLPVNIQCVNLLSKDEYFRFTLEDEKNAYPSLASEAGRYLYEPNAALMKAGAFKLPARRFGLQKIAVSSHLYTADSLMAAFPGRCFEVVETLPYNNEGRRRIAKCYPQANITVRNFPATAAELHRRLKIADGGDTYIFATTMHDGSKHLIVCRKARLQ